MIENPQGGEREFTYDSTDLLTSETDEDDNTHQYVYDNQGLLKEEIYPDGSSRKINPRGVISLINNLPSGKGTYENPADMPDTFELKACSWLGI